MAHGKLFLEGETATPARHAPLHPTTILIMLVGWGMAKLSWRQSPNSV